MLIAGVVFGITAASAKTARLGKSHTVVKPRRIRPDGVGGRWSLAFDAEFNGTSLNTRVWSKRNGWTDQNAVTDEASNVSVADGFVNLTLSSQTTGAEIAAKTGQLRVGDYAEARVSLPGKGSTMEDWDAFWAAGPHWPAAGENDVAESLGGDLTVNYHSPSGTHNKGPIKGRWAGGFHTYGIYRGRGYVNVYYDGRKVKGYRTADDGEPETLLFTVGDGEQDPVATGAAGTMRIDFLRVWKRAR